MRALVLREPGRPPEVEDLGIEDPRGGEVAVRVMASGVCRSDLHVADGDWAFPGPVVLGHEGAGVVEAVGPGVAEPGVGDPVALSWYWPCLACADCQRGRPWACARTGANDHLQPDGTTRLRDASGGQVLAYLSVGTLAERAVVPAQAAIPLPAGVPWEVAALIDCCVTTGVGAVLHAAGVAPGEPVVVFGLGGVGLSVVMGAVLAGAHPLVAVDRVRAKLDLALELGATAAVEAGDDAETLARVREATGGGAAYAFEAAGLPRTAELAIQAVRMGGTAVLVGLPAQGERASFDVERTVEGSVSIVGANYGRSVPAVDFPRLARLYLAGRLPIDRLVEERIGLDAAPRALEALRTGQGIRRVVVFEPGNPRAPGTVVRS
ncbi:MAG TPA: alcohol dehydrogenase catalytic domain-containing protein [Actinomycetota bacterium]|nr:alcohol dehydrogenase catalytic domain-containing protein [Actinomycetota bacterium]